jgi:hypothetical protein
MTLLDAPPAAATVTADAPVTLPFSVRFDVDSKIAGRAYRIFVFQPLAPPPPGGYPVVTMSDGNMNFPIAMVMAAMFQQATPAMVVAVGYPTTNPLELATLRTRDLTPPTPLENIIITPGQPPAVAENYGGGPQFLRFLTEELRPLIAGRWSVDAKRQTLYGYSLGGLFTLNALFAEPDAFSAYVAGSPSIWWNGRALLEGEAGFARRVTAGEIAPRVLVTIGELEQDPPRSPVPNMTEAQVRELVEQARMVENALELGARLAALKGAADYDARFHCFEAEDHLTAMSGSVARALDFALRP